MTGTMATALSYLHEHRLAVIPVRRDKKPLIAWQEYQNRLPDTSEVREWWTKYPDANIAVVTEGFPVSA